MMSTVIMIIDYFFAAAAAPFSPLSIVAFFRYSAVVRVQHCSLAYSPLLARLALALVLILIR